MGGHGRRRERLGKTTTIGKLAAKLQRQGQKVPLGAGDTFRRGRRRAARDLGGARRRAHRARQGGHRSRERLLEAVQRGAQDGADVVLCDTAGRLHTKAPPVEELKKVKRASARRPRRSTRCCSSSTDERQNAIAQARQFHEALGVTGIVLTKLDGTAKGGVIIGICDELGIPVRYVGSARASRT